LLDEVLKFILNSIKVVKGIEGINYEGSILMRLALVATMMKRLLIETTKMCHICNYDVWEKTL